MSNNLKNPLFWNYGIKKIKKLPKRKIVSSREISRLKRSMVEDSLDSVFGKLKRDKTCWTNKVYEYQKRYVR